MSHFPVPRRPVLLAVLLAFSSTALAGPAQKWLADSEAAFREGTLKNLILTSTGELRLSRQFKSLTSEAAEPLPPLVHALAEAKDGTLYAATGPDGRILAIKDGEMTTLVTLESHPLLTALLIEPSGTLLVGASGESASLFRITPEGVSTPIPLPDETHFVWGLAQSKDGSTYIATGPTGKLFVLPPNSTEPQVLFETDEESNLTALAISPTTGDLYFGTDTHSLVVRFSLKNKTASVLFDAPEPEISALTFDPQGNLYVATSSPESAGLLDSPMEHLPSGQPDSAPFNTDPAIPDPILPPQLPPTPQPKRDLLFLQPAPPTPAPAEPTPDPIDPPDDADPTPPKPKPRQGHDHSQPSSIPLNIPNAPEGLPPEGNAVYRIDTEGFVSEVFRAPITLFALVESEGVLTLATGSEGLLYQVDTRRDESAQIARADGKDITALLKLSSGALAVGISNPGAVATLSSGLASEGTFTSQIFDASSTARFGTLRLDGSLPEGTTLTLSTRSGNTATPPDDTDSPLGWNPWSAELPAQRFVQIPSPPARYFQYRLTLKPAQKKTPVIRAAEASYGVPNVAPRISSLTVTDTASEPGKPVGSTMSVTWDATDLNSDTLSYSLQYRPSGETDWRPLKNDLTETSFELDTRPLVDGRYQLRVTASDAPSNPRGEQKTASRVSTSFLVDNTPPHFSAVEVRVVGKSATLNCGLTDAAGTVASLHYRIDAGTEWQTAQAGDKLFDSPAEQVTLSTGDLSPGRHVVHLKATDDRGNERFETVLIEIP